MREPTFENALAFAQDLIRIPSLPGQEGAVSERVRDEMQALGFADVRIDELGSVVGVVRGRGEAPPVMLSCHLDIVAPGDPAQWEHPPYGGVVEGGFLHGRGAMDIKGPLALQTYAAAMLAGQAAGDVIVAHTVLEERGGWGMEHLMKSGTVRPAAVIIGEATHGDIALGHRGRAEAEVVLRGVAGHASAPDRARNALDLLPAALAGIGALAEDDRSDPVLGRATAVATGVEVRPESRNVIPDEVVVVVDWRILPGSTSEALVEALETAIARHMGPLPDGFGIDVRMAREHQRTWTGVERDRPMFTPGFLVDADHPVVRAAASAAGRRNGTGAAHARPWAFATDGGWTCGVHGIPSFGFAPGEERHAHTNTERLDLEEARWALDRYPHIVQAVQAAVV
ncbi:MAG: M20/M25/M40 family metallo-hydrolase [Gemmatimonadota bacterium]